MKMTEIKIQGSKGKWTVIDEITIEGRQLYLLENEIYSESVPKIIIDKDLNIVEDEVFNGFEDYLEKLKIHKMLGIYV